MNADSCFFIGQSHQVCQDYAVSGLTEDHHPYAILSDGCSTANDTDFGARFLVRNAIRSLQAFGEVRPEWVLGESMGYDQILDLDSDFLTATLLALYETGDGDLHFMAAGDGVLAARRPDGGIEHWVIEYAHSAPAYLCYLANPNRLSRYLEMGGGKRVIRYYRNGEQVSETYSTAVPTNNNWVLYMNLDADQYDIVAILSDGAQSFLRTTPTGNKRVPVHEVVEQVMAMKNTTGDFVVRRVRNGFLRRFCVKHGWHHYDDLAVAAIYLG